MLAARTTAGMAAMASRWSRVGIIKGPDAMRPTIPRHRHTGTLAATLTEEAAAEGATLRLLREVTAKTEIKKSQGEWEAAPEADQNWYINEAKPYEKARKKTGRTAWFEDAYKPVTVTACQKGQGEGTVCGFVYFPCSDVNGCTAVTNGAF